MKKLSRFLSTSSILLKNFHFRFQNFQHTSFILIVFSEPRRHQLVKQDSVISFADQRRGLLNKQDSIIGCSSRSGDGTGHHVSILKKTDSQLSSGSFSSPRRNIEIYE